MVAIVGTIATLFFIGPIQIEKENTVNPAIVDEPLVETSGQEKRQLWLDNKAINADYVGEIIFESGIIDKPFVQAKSVYDKDGNLYHFYNEDGTLVSDPEGYSGNDVYIWTNWRDMSYDYNILGGSIFMEERNSINDQNIIIYGHHFSKRGGNDPDRNKAFTPLELLLDKENYEANSIVHLILDNETRSYELACVYEYDVDDDFYTVKTQYYRTNYAHDDFENIVDDAYYDKYIEAIDSVKLYDTGVTLSNTDQTLTLQTCLSGRAAKVFEICVFKLIDTEYFRENN